MSHATAAEILLLTPRTAAPLEEGELPASVEFCGPHGMINYFLVARAAPEFYAREEIAALEGGLRSLKLLQSEQDPSGWTLAARGANMDIAPVEYPMDAGEVTALLTRFGIALPGLQPSERQPDARPEPDAPPF